MKTITGDEYWNLSLEERKNFTGIVKWGNGDISHYKNGLYHREDGPARIFPDFYLEWWNEGLLHNLIGPAVVYPNGNKGYFIHGNKSTKEAVELLRDLCVLKRIKI
jgi:hypothetical protein